MDKPKPSVVAIIVAIDAIKALVATEFHKLSSDRTLISGPDSPETTITHNGIKVKNEKTHIVKKSKN